LRRILRPLAAAARWRPHWWAWVSPGPPRLHPRPVGRDGLGRRTPGQGRQHRRPADRDRGRRAQPGARHPPVIGGLDIGTARTTLRVW